MSRRITEKNKEFIREYFKTGNATRSYMKVYENKNEKYCRGQAYVLLSFPEAKKYVKELQEQQREAFIFDMCNVQKFWVEVMLDEKEKMPNRLKASELLTKSLGGFEDKQTVNLNGTVIFTGEDKIED